MTKLEQLNLLKDRKAVLIARGKDNGKIVTKISRRIKKLEKDL